MAGPRLTRKPNRTPKTPDPLTCWICGEPINPHLPAHHPQSRTHNLMPPPNGKHRRSTRLPAHRHCSEQRGNTTITPKDLTPNTRDW